MTPQTTLGELIAGVGGVVHADHTVTFGSPMAVQAMLDQLTRLYQQQLDDYVDDCRTAVDIAMAHIAEVNVELAETRVALHSARQLVGMAAVSVKGNPPFGTSSGTGDV